MTGPITIHPVEDGADRRAFVEIAYRLNESDPHWVPPLRTEVHGLIDPKVNPWFEHGEAKLFMAARADPDGAPGARKWVGRISAQVDRLVQEAPAEQGGGPGTGQWGLFEAADGEAAAALIAAAEGWLRERGMTRALGPFSLSIWDEPGLLVKGHDHSPTVMMGHNSAAYQPWVEAAGYRGVKDLLTYDLDFRQPMPPIVQRIVASGERSGRIRIRRVDKRRFDEEAAIILSIFNDAWGNNWGFVPLTDAEIAHAGKKMKPIVFEELIRIAEIATGPEPGAGWEPAAFMISVPDLNELMRDLGGRLFPFGWAKLLWRLRHPQVETMRVPLMGVVQRLQGSRLASQLAFMMIEYIRRDAMAVYSARRAEIGWILDDNKGMRAIAETIESRVNRVYRIYEKALA